MDKLKQSEADNKAKMIWGSVTVLVLMALASFIWTSYWYWPEWAGLYTPQSGTYEDWKLLWDWLELAIIPLALILIAYIFNKRQKENELEIARKQREQDREIALMTAEKQRKQDREIAQDRVQETALQNYLDKMTELLLEYNLRASEETSEVRSIARSRTLTILSSLDDGRRKASIVHFLYEAGLIGGQESFETVINLEKADLREANLGEADLTGANLRGAKLQKAILEYTGLEDAILEEANLTGANLWETILVDADLRRASLREADLEGANLWGADLRRAKLNGANLSRANLQKANLQQANLQQANLQQANLAEGASLGGANLEKANLSGANLGWTQFDEADLRGADLRGATLHVVNFKKTKIDDTTQIDDKWRLVWEIVNQGAEGRDLSEIDLSKANLLKANLRKANLRGTNLEEADLGGADLREADLREANLRANLGTANLEDAKYNSKTTWPTGFDPEKAGAVKVND